MTWIRNLILWIFLGSKVSIPKQKTPAILIFELGALQVYHFPTPEQITRNIMSQEIYWQDKNTKETFGPFISIFEAMLHYTWMVQNYRLNKGKTKDNVIHVDFRKKRRQPLSPTDAS